MSKIYNKYLEQMKQIADKSPQWTHECAAIKCVIDLLEKELIDIEKNIMMKIQDLHEKLTVNGKKVKIKPVKLDYDSEVEKMITSADEFYVDISCKKLKEIKKDEANT